jgi:hypothetical protein
MKPGAAVSPDDYDVIVDSDTDLTVDGRLVFAFRKGVITTAICDRARESWGDVDTFARPSVTRRAAAGPPSIEAFRAYRDDVAELVPATATTCHLRLTDGRVLKQPMSNPVLSYLAGYGVDRFTRTARANLLTNRYPGRWVRSLGFFRAVDEVHRAVLPAVNQKQRDRVALHPAWSIPGTGLSTITINVNYESRYHLDTGDFDEGYSALTVVEIGSYDGGYFVMPGHRVAIDVREGDVLLCQSHVDMHGNAPIVKRSDDAKRISFVCYLKHALASAVNRLDAPQVGA